MLTELTKRHLQPAAIAAKSQKQLRTVWNAQQKIMKKQKLFARDNVDLGILSRDPERSLTFAKATLLWDVPRNNNINNTLKMLIIGTFGWIFKILRHSDEALDHESLSTYSFCAITTSKSKSYCIGIEEWNPVSRHWCKNKWTILSSNNVKLMLNYSATVRESNLMNSQ